MLELLNVQKLVVLLEVEGISVEGIRLALAVQKQLYDLITTLEQDIPY